MSGRRAVMVRQGLSILELLGCVSAVGCGLIAGSIYLGVDVLGVAARLAGRAPTPVAAIPTAPIGAVQATTPAVSPPPNQAATPVSTPTAPTSAAPAAVAPAAPVAAAPAPAPTLMDAITLTPQQEDALTRGYWDALNESMRAEVTHRTAGLQKTGNWELYDYLSARSDGHQTAATAIAQLSRHGVDPHVVDFANKVRAWHEEGAKLYSRARDLLTDAPTAQLSGPFAQSWQSAATQHQMEERLLTEKRQAVQSYLDHGDRSATDATPASP